MEVTSDRLLAKCFTWLVRRHTMASYSLYMAGQYKRARPRRRALPRRGGTLLARRLAAPKPGARTWHGVWCCSGSAGFVWFVLGLKKSSLLYQFGQFAWTHTIILTVVVPSSFIVSNMFEGIIWWLLPALLVIANDICAYLAGARLWGRKRLWGRCVRWRAAHRAPTCGKHTALPHFSSAPLLAPALLLCARRLHVWPHAAHQAFAQEDGRGLCRRRAGHGAAGPGAVAGALAELLVHLSPARECECGLDLDQGAGHAAAAAARMHRRRRRASPPLACSRTCTRARC